MNKRTFTKIRKWAEEKGFEIKEKRGYGDTPEIDVIVNEELWFTLNMKQSTIYQSIRGQRGERAGLYLTTERRPNGKWQRSYAFHKDTQVDAIREMEYEMKGKW